MFRVSPGDHVAYSAKFLRSIGCHTGPLPFARGEVVEVQELGKNQLATIQWNSEGVPEKVLACNLAIVGPNMRFANCD